MIPSAAIPEKDRETIAPILAALDAAFRPMVTTIAHDIEPSVILSEAAVDAE